MTTELPTAALRDYLFAHFGMHEEFIEIDKHLEVLDLAIVKAREDEHGGSCDCKYVDGVFVPCERRKELQAECEALEGKK